MPPRVVKEEIPEAKIRQVIWYLKTGKTKKFACEHLGIAYNTKRLDKIIEDFKASVEREKVLKAKGKVLVLTDEMKNDIVKRYSKGDAQSAIASDYFISPQRVKAVLLERSVPIRARAKRGEAKTEHIIQDLDKQFAVNDRVFASKLNSFCYVTRVINEEYIERLRLGRQRYVETYPWDEKTSRFSEPQEGIHYEIYWEIDEETFMKKRAIESSIKSYENLIAKYGQELYEVSTDDEYKQSHYVLRENLFAVEIR